MLVDVGISTTVWTRASKHQKAAIERLTSIEREARIFGRRLPGRCDRRNGLTTTGRGDRVFRVLDGAFRLHAYLQ
jgi:hypothetical protein